MRESGTTPADLRREFDRVFAQPLSGTPETMVDLLILRINGDRYALRLAEIDGLHADRAITAIPSPVVGLLGVTGIRGRLVPVYSLPALLGHDAAGATNRWLVLCRSPHPVALAFDHAERYVRLPALHVHDADPSNVQVEHVRAVAHADVVTYPIVAIPSVLARITKRCELGHASKEQ